MTILIPRRHYTQPHGRVALAPEFYGAKTAWVGSASDRCLARDKLLTVLGTPTHAVTEHFVGMYSADYSQRNWVEVRSGIPPKDAWPGVTVISDLVATTVSGLNYYQAISSFMPVGLYWGGWNLSVEWVSGARTVYWRAGDSAAYLGSAVYWEPGQRLRLGTTYDRAQGRMELSVIVGDQPLRRDVLTGHTSAMATGLCIENIGGYERNGYRSSLHKIGAVLVFPYALPAEGVSDLLANPYQAFRADPVRIYSLPTGAITLNSLTMSAITQTTARATLGLTR